MKSKRSVSLTLFTHEAVNAGCALIRTTYKSDTIVNKKRIETHSTFAQIFLDKKLSVVFHFPFYKAAHLLRLFEKFMRNVPSDPAHSGTLHRIREVSDLPCVSYAMDDSTNCPQYELPQLREHQTKVSAYTWCKTENQSETYT